MKAQGTDLPRFDSLILAGNTREEVLRTIRNVRDVARDEDDAHFLLQVLGLAPTPPPPAHKKKWTSNPATTTADAPINTTTGSAQ